MIYGSIWPIPAVSGSNLSQLNHFLGLKQVFIPSLVVCSMTKNYLGKANEKSASGSSWTFVTLS